MLMLDIKLIRENPMLVKNNLEKRLQRKLRENNKAIQDKISQDFLDKYLKDY